MKRTQEDGTLRLTSDRPQLEADSVALNARVMTNARSGSLEQLSIVGLFDLDGTSNDESTPERDRIGTIGPAKEAITQFGSYGISVGICTARSMGEAFFYSKALGTTGPIIAEDGASIYLPGATKETLAAAGLSEYPVFPYEGGMVIVPSQVAREQIENYLRAVDASAASGQTEYRPIISSFSSAEDILRELGVHENVHMAALSAERYGSAYTINASDRQLQAMCDLAAAHQVRLFDDVPGRIPHIFGANVTKGTSLQLLVSQLYRGMPGSSDIDGILPLTFGNSRNDVPLFHQTVQSGGVAVCVAHHQGGHPEYVTSNSPSEVIYTEKPFGHGINEAIPAILTQLRTKYGFNS